MNILVEHHPEIPRRHSLRNSKAPLQDISNLKDSSDLNASTSTKSISKNVSLKGSKSKKVFAAPNGDKMHVCTNSEMVQLEETESSLKKVKAEPKQTKKRKSDEFTTTAPSIVDNQEPIDSKIVKKPERKSYPLQSKSECKIVEKPLKSSVDDCVLGVGQRRSTRDNRTKDVVSSVMIVSDSSGSIQDSAEWLHIPKKQRTLPLSQSIPLKMNEPEKCLDILDKMYDNYFKLEEQYTPKPYLHIQKDINAKMRAILVDWLVEVHYKFKLHPSTIWLCVNILDRYLEQVETVRGDLQLVGVSAFLIACKYEEIFPPEVKDCVFITDYAYTREQILIMETKILRLLDYQICVPTGYHFLTHYLNSLKANDKVKHLAFYYAERNLQEIDMLSQNPHKFVAASLYAALKYQHDSSETNSPSTKDSVKPIWSPELTQLSGTTEEELIPCAKIILKVMQQDLF